MRKLQKREIIILVLLLLLASSILFEYVSYNYYFDKKNDVQKSDLIKYVDNINIEGTWGIPGFTYVSMTFEDKRNKKYSVEYVSGSCLNDWKVNRMSFYDGDVIILDRPVQDDFRKKYRKLFTIEYRGEECLLPFCYAKDFEDAIINNEDRCGIWLLRRLIKSRQEWETQTTLMQYLKLSDDRYNMPQTGKTK